MTGNHVCIYVYRNIVVTSQYTFIPRMQVLQTYILKITHSTSPLQNRYSPYSEKIDTNNNNIYISRYIVYPYYDLCCFAVIERSYGKSP